jgi:hypothetical protein
VPPDTQVAAGINSAASSPALNLVEMVNGTIRVSDGLGHPINTVDICSFFFCDFFTAVISDPIVRYDPEGQRWFASILTIEYLIQGIFLVPEGSVAPGRFPNERPERRVDGLCCDHDQWNLS